MPEFFCVTFGVTGIVKYKSGTFVPLVCLKPSSEFFTEPFVLFSVNSASHIIDDSHIVPAPRAFYIKISRFSAENFRQLCSKISNLARGKMKYMIAVIAFCPVRFFFFIECIRHTPPPVQVRSSLRIYRASAKVKIKPTDRGGLLLRYLLIF